MPNPIEKKHHDLLDDYVAEIEATLDREDDDEMGEALDDLKAEMSEDRPTHETLSALVVEVSSYLDGNDDETLEELHGMVLEIPRPNPANRPTT